jgi:putative transcriptional regulator
MQNTFLKPNRFLLATPELQGSFFEGSIILLLDHHESGSYGLIINKFQNMPFNEVFFPGCKTRDLHSFLLAGPVDQEKIHQLRRAETNSDHKFELEVIANDANAQNISDSCFFLGYAGWGQEQLEKEIRDGCWQVADCDVKPIFESLLSGHKFVMEEFSPHVLSGEDFVP